MQMRSVCAFNMPSFVPACPIMLPVDLKYRLLGPSGETKPFVTNPPIESLMGNFLINLKQFTEAIIPSACF